MTTVYIFVLIVLLVATLWHAWRLSQRIDTLVDRNQILASRNLAQEFLIQDLETRAAARVKRTRGIIAKERRA